MTIFISPTEPAVFRPIGKTSSRPERKGVDFLIVGGKRIIGVQRKEFPGDFIASLHDDRLYTQLQQMASLPEKLIVLEGYGSWTTDGELVADHRAVNITKQAVYALLFSIMFEAGVPVLWVRDQADTRRILETLEGWAKKDKHNSLRRRAKPKASGWGTVDSRSWSNHVLQSFPGVGPQTADSIIDHFGYLPLTWTVSPDELMEVPGVGKKTAQALDKALAYVQGDK